MPENTTFISGVLTGIAMRKKADSFTPYEVHPYSSSVLGALAGAGLGGGASYLMSDQGTDPVQTQKRKRNALIGALLGAAPGAAAGFAASIGPGRAMDYLTNPSNAPTMATDGKGRMWAVPSNIQEAGAPMSTWDKTKSTGGYLLGTAATAVPTVIGIRQTMRMRPVDKEGKPIADVEVRKAVPATATSPEIPAEFARARQGPWTQLRRGGWKGNASIVGAAVSAILAALGANDAMSRK